MNRPNDRSDTALTLTATGVTLLGVLLSIGVTVGIGVSGPWWVRLLAGAGSTLLLIVIVKTASKKGHGPLARLANWTISAHDPSLPEPLDEEDRRSSR